ncbi:MAG: alkene reductase [Woeseia sp.]|nr:alkene reductase [Woeseia sp.]NNE62400.1 alkene reductase [Woeseia sp.]NNL55347.1 alkene reductase [Woeseia sp.]
MTTRPLFEPLTIGDITLRNRIVMAPMTRNRAQDTIPQPMMKTYYRQRASAGLIITEASQVSPQGVGYPNTPGIHNDEQIAGWKKITEAVHAEGGTIFLQLWHVGRISHPSLQPNGQLPVAPSAIKPDGKAFTPDGMQPFQTPRALDTDELPGIVEQFVSGAKNAMKAGFDGVEIHGANGYLLDQFLRSGSNQREDDFGGSVENRARLLLEVTDAVCGAVGPGRTSVRLSPGSTFNDMHDEDPAKTFDYVTRELGQRALAYLHVIESDDDSDALDYDALKTSCGGVYMANDGYEIEDARNSINNGRADLVSFGKLFISNPDLPERLLKDAPLACADPDTFYGGGEEGYIDYPEMARDAA